MSWRVWVQEWVSVYTSDREGDAGAAECQAHFDKSYAGRVHPRDLHIDSPSGSWPATLQLKLHNVRGEFRENDDAAGFRDRISEAEGREYVRLTELGSAEDQELESYGRKMLPA